MTDNLLRDSWTDLDTFELRLLLDKRTGGPGQYDDRSSNPNKLYLPLAGSSCRIVITFREKENKITAIEPGEEFEVAGWEQVSKEIENSILAGPMKVGRDISFSGFRVPGSWRGKRSGVQILPPPDDAPRAHVEMAEHPFILELPIKASEFWPVTNHRRMREHRKLTLLLNVLLTGRTSLQPRRSGHFWAIVYRDDDRQTSKWLQKVRKWCQKVRQFFLWWSRGPRSASRADHEIKWAQEFYFAKFGKLVIDDLSPPAGEQLEEVDPEEYYTTVGYDGKGLRVPADLDGSICCYMALSAEKRAKFDRAAFWIDMASQQWNTSVSASFVALVTAIESLTERGVQGPTRRFKEFFDTYAPGAAMAKRRDDMYSLRSGITHGSELMQLDQDIAFGWDPHWRDEGELQEDLWGLTRVALRNWPKEQPAI